MSKELITDEQELVGAKTQWGTSIKTYDDAFGSLWLYRDAGGLVGVIRAMSEGDAYEIVEDEILTPIPEEDVIEAYGYYTLPENVYSREESKWWAAYNDNDLGCPAAIAKFDTEQEAVKYCLDTIAREEVDLVEGYSYQPNSSGTGIVLHDLNGEQLDELTPELLKETGITLEIQDL